MRDLLHYPITDAEIIQYLERTQQQISESYRNGDGPIGGTDGVVVGILIAKMKSESSLRADCAKWVKVNEVNASETIYQVDSVQEALYELAEIVCHHVGFHKE